MQNVTKPRPLLSLTILACALTLTACMDESCGITSPSEAVGSHGENAVERIVLVYFYDELGSADGMRVTTANASIFVTERLNPGRLLVKAAPDDTISFLAVVEGLSSGAPRASATCSFKTASLAGVRLTGTLGNDDGRVPTNLSLFCNAR